MTFTIAAPQGTRHRTAFESRSIDASITHVLQEFADLLAGFMQVRVPCSEAFASVTHRIAVWALRHSREPTLLLAYTRLATRGARFHYYLAEYRQARWHYQIRCARC
jgi:hypothetical protein